VRTRRAAPISRNVRPSLRRAAISATATPVTTVAAIRAVPNRCPQLPSP